MCPVEFIPLDHYLHLALSYLAVGGPAYLGLRWIRAYERRSQAPERYDAMAERLQALEATLDRVEEQMRHALETAFRDDIAGERAAIARRQVRRG